MPAYKTPGVYVEEISTLPASVAQVETAIPAFIGYTEKAEEDGKRLFAGASGLPIPKRISSLAEFREMYGGPPPLTGINVDLDAVGQITKIAIDDTFLLYDSLQLFYDNGGGDCYVVSVGLYDDADDAPSLKKLKGGLNVLEKFDEPTLILFPDAVRLGDPAELHNLQNLTLKQCNKLQDRFGVFDLRESPSGDDPEWEDSVTTFRERLGMNNLKYGAAYTPWLKVSYEKNVRYRDFDTLRRAGTGMSWEKLTTNPDIKGAVLRSENALSISKKIEGASLPDIAKDFNTKLDKLTNSPAQAELNALFASFAGAARKLKAWHDFNETLTAHPTDPTGDDDSLKKSFGASLGQIADANKDTIAALIKYHRGAETSGVADPVPANFYDEFIAAPWPTGGDAVDPGASDPSIFGETAPTETEKIIPAIDELRALGSGLLAMLTDVERSASELSASTETSLREAYPLYKAVVTAVSKHATRMPPSGAIVGIYAAVDRNRGVWKAPANVSLTSVRDLSFHITHEEQERLNVDVTAGKSINAIRRFAGKGLLVWGARTLAGNDNEWRYVPVRRFYNMVEESLKKSTAWVVFEPNDANTWVRVKGMIVNYLTTLWRAGALAGPTPQAAFFVNIGLGETMTPLDILEGRMIIEVGMAAVRPAEFIILRFSHKLQEA